jgi:hypothetical protein
MDDANLNASLRVDAQDAPDGGSYTEKRVCQICGAAAERKRRPNGSWFFYSRCRRCRRLPSHKPLLGNTIRDERLSSLVFALYHHLVILKQEGWQGASKRQAVHGLGMLLGVLKEA